MKTYQSLGALIIISFFLGHLSGVRDRPRGLTLVLSPSSKVEKTERNPERKSGGDWTRRDFLKAVTTFLSWKSVETNEVFQALSNLSEVPPSDAPSDVNEVMAIKTPIARELMHWITKDRGYVDSRNLGDFFIYTWDPFEASFVNAVEIVARAGGTSLVRPLLDRMKALKVYAAGYTDDEILEGMRRSLELEITGGIFMGEFGQLADLMPLSLPTERGASLLITKLQTEDVFWQARYWFREVMDGRFGGVRNQPNKAAEQGRPNSRSEQSGTQLDESSSEKDTRWQEFLRAHAASLTGKIEYPKTGEITKLDSEEYASAYDWLASAALEAARAAGIKGYPGTDEKMDVPVLSAL